MATNKHGLSRSIPDGVRREVRQRCGFGCVVCGRAVIDYEHFDPPFAECQEHRAAGITLLCIECHGRKERKWLALDAIIEANANPRCRQLGFSFGPFDLGRKAMPEIEIGVVTMRNTSNVLRIYGDDILSIRSPEQEGAPFLLSARLFDVDGKEIISIVDNEWRTYSENWDVQAEGGRISIRRGPGEIAIQMRVDAPTRLVVERLEMAHKGAKISCREHQPLQIEQRNGQQLSTHRLTIDDCKAGIVLDDSGLYVGQGGGAVFISQMTISSGGKSVSTAMPSSVPNLSPPVRQKTSSLISTELFARLLSKKCSCGSGLAYRHCHGKFI